MTPSQNALRRGFCIFLPVGKSRRMSVFIATLVLAGFLSMAIYHFFRNKRYRESTDERTRLLPLFLFIDVLQILADIILGEGIEQRLILDVYLSCVVLLFLISSLHWRKDSIVIPTSLAVIQILIAAYYLLCRIGIINIFNVAVCVNIICGLLLALFMQYCISMFLWIRQIKKIMQYGNVWTCLGLSVEVFYIAVLAIYALIPRIFMPSPLLCVILCALLMSMAVAMCVRISTDGLFAVWTEHERNIAESINISASGSSGRNTKTEVVYKEIYDRLVSLFENDRLYLNSELSINDIVKVIFTNRAYISRAINQYTGRNFCQFVNSYRVNHSIKRFRENPELKVAELANLSGFNTVGSFATAFKYHMYESPSDWCRKERTRLIKTKK